MKLTFPLFSPLQRWFTVAVLVGLPCQDVFAATYYVDVTQGDDGRGAAEAQSADTPWQTLSRALGAGSPLVAGDVVQVGPGDYVTATTDGGLEYFPLQLADGVAVVGAGPSTVLHGPEGGSVFLVREDLGADTRVADLALVTPGTPGINVDNTTAKSIALSIDGVDGSGCFGLVQLMEAVGPVVMEPTIENSVFPIFSPGVRVVGTSPVGDLVVKPTLTGNTFYSTGTAVDIYVSGVEGAIDVAPELTHNTMARGPSPYGYPVVNATITGIVSEYQVAPVVKDNLLLAPSDVVRLDVQTLSSSEVAGSVEPTIRSNQVNGADNLLYIGTVHSGQAQMTIQADVSDNELSNVGAGIYGGIGGYGGIIAFGAAVEGNRGSVTGDAAGRDRPMIQLSQNKGGSGYVTVALEINDNELSAPLGMADINYNGGGFVGGAVSIEAHRNDIEGSSEGSFIIANMEYIRGLFPVAVNASDNIIRGAYHGLALYLYSASVADISLDGEVFGNEMENAVGSLLEATASYIAQSQIETDLNVHDNVVRRSGGGVNCTFEPTSGTEGVSKVEVRDNDFLNNTGHGVSINQTGEGGGNSDLEVIVKDNLITGGKRGVGLSVNALMSGHSGLASLDISDNEVSGCAQDGVWLGIWEISSGGSLDHTTTITGNDIIGCAAGVSGSVTGSFSGGRITEDVIIASNEIEDSQADGVHYRHDSMGGVELNSEVRAVGNIISNPDRSGVVFAISELYSSPGVVTGSMDWGAVSNSITYPGSEGVAVSFFEIGGLIGGHFNYELTGNSVFGAGGNGLSLLGDAEGAAMSQGGLISGNVLLASQNRGLWIELVGQGGVSESNIKVADNVVRESRLTGVSVTSSGYQGGTDTSLSGNTITDNGGDGVEIGAGMVTDTEVKVDLGGGDTDSPGKNTFTGNREHQIRVRAAGEDERSSSPTSQRVAGPTLNALNNWWGTTDEAAIAAAIYSENATVAVDTSSALAAAPLLSVEVELVATVDDAEPVDAEPGDLISLQASLAITGEVGCAGARLHADLPEGTELVERSVVTAVGAALASDDLEIGLGWLEVGAELTVSWQLRIPEDTQCDEIQVQARLSCEQLGEVLSDDPAAPGAHDPTAIGLASYIYYVDADGDGEGDVDGMLTTCHAQAPDGYAEGSGDCDDADPQVNPQGTEVCDETDNDCDGEVDEELASVFIADGDGDGFGNGDDQLVACEAPRGYLEPEASAGNDCDDSRSDIHPTAAEVCDIADNDCDGSIDEGGLSSFYADADGDGHGDAAQSIEACGLVEGHVLSADDCDDADASIHPGSSETCDEIDNDCDGTVDEEGGDLAYTDDDGDGFGDPASPMVGCLPDSGVALVAGDCDDGDAAIYPGADERCNELDDDCDHRTDEGAQQAFYADDDGDGYGDAIAVTFACTGPSGTVDNPDDCDDDDSTVSPEAAELCDGLDNDCDRDTDEGVETLFYEDADGDGYGDALTSAIACEAPEGTVEDPSDCDDADPAVNPDPETVEVCNGVDDNCDGAVDDAAECEPSATPGETDAGGGGGCDSSGGGSASWLGFFALLPLVGLRRRSTQVALHPPRS